MKYFFRTKQEPVEFYSARPIANYRCHNIPIHVSWKLKKIGSDLEKTATTREIVDGYEPCSPFEALGATKT